jgi:hypothetical protein
MSEERDGRRWTIYVCALDHGSPSRNKGGRCATCGREVKEVEVMPVGDGGEGPPLHETLLEARAALHRLCLERGSTDGYRAIFAALNAALGVSQ